MVNQMSFSFPKVANLTKCHLRHIKGETSGETDTKTSKQKEPNQKYRLGTVNTHTILANHEANFYIMPPWVTGEQYRTNGPLVFVQSSRFLESVLG